MIAVEGHATPGTEAGVGVRGSRQGVKEEGGQA